MKFLISRFNLVRTVKRLSNFILFQHHILSPGKIVVLAAAWAIALGTVLLMLPWATTSSHNLPLIDALFTATSAVCVTGLIVADTAEDFTAFGQTIILI